MDRMTALALPLALMLALGGCSSLDVFGIWSDDAETGAADTPQGFEAAAVPVQAVRSLEIGRTRSGYMITAFGTAKGLGYGKPHLRPRRDGALGVEGFIDFDFVAFPPDPAFDLGVGTIEARALRADLPVDADALRGARGIRVHGAAGGVQFRF